MTGINSKDGANKLKFSIWDTRTEENLDDTKEKFAEAMEYSDLNSKTTEHKE
jgi:hypothetical protein